MIEKLYKKENNLFQSEDWRAFQESFGREIIEFSKNKSFGVKIGLPAGKSFIWIQKGPTGKVDLAEIKEVGKKEGAVFVRIEPEEKIAFKEVNFNSLLSGQKSPKATHILDISKSEEDVLAQMKSKTRYNIRLAEKKGVQAKITDNVDVLFELLKETASRSEYAPHEKAYYEEMIKELGGKDLVKIIVAGHKNKPSAAILVSFYGEVATYLHGGSSLENKELMAPYLCQWEAIKFAKKNGQKIYDFWGVAETDDPKNPWAGITRFKEGFGGEKVVFAGAYDIKISKLWYNILTIGAKLKHLLRSL